MDKIFVITTVYENNCKLMVNGSPFLVSIAVNILIFAKDSIGK